MSTYTLFVETNGEGGIPSQRLLTEFREGDLVVWSRDRVTFFRALRSDELSAYRRVRRTELASIGIETPQTTHELQLPLGSQEDIVGVMRERYGECIPSLAQWEWRPQGGLFRAVKRRFVATSRSA